MLLKGQRSRIRKEQGWKVNQMWTKGGQEGRSCIDMETLKIQKSGVSQGPGVWHMHREHQESW